MSNAYSFCNGCWKDVHNKKMKVREITNNKVMTKNKDNKISKQMRISLKIVIKTTNNSSKISKKDRRNNSSKTIKRLKMCTRQRFRIIKRGTNLHHLKKDNSNNNRNRNSNNNKMNFHPPQ